MENAKKIHFPFIFPRGKYGFLDCTSKMQFNALFKSKIGEDFILKKSKNFLKLFNFGGPKAELPTLFKAQSMYSEESIRKGYIIEDWVSVLRNPRNFLFCGVQWNKPRLSAQNKHCSRQILGENIRSVMGVDSCDCTESPIRFLKNHDFRSKNLE